MPLDGRLQPPPRLVIVEDFRPALQRDLANDLSHNPECRVIPSSPLVATQEQFDLKSLGHYGPLSARH
jgi:hypothetical protein